MRNVVIRTITLLCLVISSAGCISPLAMQPLITASDVDLATSVPSPAPSPTATEIPAVDAEEALPAAVEEELDTLSYWIGHWRAMRLTETPVDDPVLREVMVLAVQSAADLDLILDAEALIAVDPYDAAEALARDLAFNVGERYGAMAQSVFEIRYTTQVANLLLWFVNDSMSAEEVQTRAYLAGNYLSAALNSAQRAGLQGELLSGGLQLARDMARGAEPLEASRAVFMWRIRVLAWLGDQRIASTAAPNRVEDGASTAEAIRPPAELYISMGCIDCHYLDEPQDGMLLNNLIAPSLAGLRQTAASRVPGQDAESYVYHSIVDPKAYEVEGYEANLMPLTYAEEMSEAEIHALVSWLLNEDRK
ncbi:MAG: hypothetical protein KF893_02105 [Caldilineaceae bacterium]|nr:hypothetical protein [Caldilineaceae bacterium]